MRKAALVVICAVTLILSAAASDTPFGYQRPPKAITDIIESPAQPTAVLSPARDRMLLADVERHMPISNLAAPMLRLAGVRINPATNGLQLRNRYVGLSLMTIPNGKQQKLAVPANATIGHIEWSGDGKRFAFTNTLANGIELWIGDATTGKLTRISKVALNAVYGDPIRWMPDNRTMLVRTIPAGRGAAPAEPKAPYGPNVQESSGRPAPARTFEDLLTNPYDEALFDYYATSQLAFIDTVTGHVTPVGKPAIFAVASVSPDGNHILVARLRRPYSYQLPAPFFPKEVEVWDRSGKVETKIASLPLEDHIPIEGVSTGPRQYRWIASSPATLMWAEALDEGDPKKAAPHRDRLMLLDAQFTAQPREFMKVQHRFQQVVFGEKGLAFIVEYERNKRWVRTFMVNTNEPANEPKLVWSLSAQDRYNDPGRPVMRRLANGQQVMWQNGDDIFLVGDGSSPVGDLPFLDRFSLKTLKAERLYRAADKTYEEVLALLSNDGSQFITQFETPNNPPNLFVVNGKDRRQLTHFPDPAPAFRGVKKQLVTYKRDDGVQLSFTLYLPVDYKEGQRLPTVVWAYPLEYTDASTASQVSGSQYRFTVPAGISHLFLLTQGYAILNNATMPVVGDPETVNNTYVEQITASAKAAIDKAVEMGVTDRNRVGVGGHSYGAFMTANLLAHTDLFKAGVARSGAYNRTLTPFGFQSERRTFWEAPDMYMKVSPFGVAHKIKTPILLIHGEADDNQGTFPIQSERMFQALKGNGATVRYVTLPHEAHAYTAKESVEHTLWEMLTWFDRWVKDAPAAKTTEAAR